MKGGITLEYVKIADIVIDSNIYPRETPDNAKIAEYKELIDDGVKFPPIVVNKRTMHLIDGYHRYRAYKSLGLLDIETELIDIPENMEWLEAIYRNTKHGIPLKRKEVKELFKKYFKLLDGKVDTEMLAEKLGVARPTIYRWINELEEKEGKKVEKETHKLSDEDKQKIVEMYETGNYTKDEIAQKFEIHPTHINNIVKEHRKFSNENSLRNLSDELTQDNKDVKPHADDNIEKLREMLEEKGFGIVEADQPDDEVDYEADEFDEEEGGDNEEIFTRDPEKIGKIFEKKLNDCLNIMADDTAIELFVEYARRQIPQYGLVMAESIRVTIPRFHMLIGKLLEGR